MSARRIRMTRTQAPLPRQDAVTRHKQERAIREAYRRERQITSYLADDENFPSFQAQLAKIGLQLRDIPGDGNCLFRALGDQFEGHVRNHFRHRQDVVKYMQDNREDFEPFVVDDTPFDKYVSNLRSLGTYAGNDAIVAFARCHQVNVVIHQLNAPFYLIQGSQAPNAKQLHVAYHNGDHYSSVRKLGDNTESPNNFRLKVGSENNCTAGATQDLPHVNGHDAGIVRAVRDTGRLVEEVMNATGCTDELLVQEALLDCYYDVDATIAYVLQTVETVNTNKGSPEDTTSLASQVTSTDSGIWCESSNGSQYLNHNGNSNHLGNNENGHPHHFRDNSIGGSSGYGSVSSQNGGARPKLNVPIVTQATEKVSAKKKKELKKLEKKKRAEERHKQKILGIKPLAVPDDEDQSVTILAKDIQMTHI